MTGDMAQSNPPPRRFGDFEITERLGRGGFGTVYKARDTTLGGRFIALKVLNADLADDPDWVRRFGREASIAANLDHPNIPVIYRFGEVGARHYIAMRFVPGQPLAALSRDAGPMAVDRMVALLEQVAEALDYAHGQGVVHRDLKPGNVLVEPGGRVALTDFGLARPVSVTGSGATVTNTLANLAGTLPYLSPEQFQDETPGPASDRYALGVTAYELLTRRYPFEATNPVALGLKVVANAPPPVRGLRPDVPERVERAITRMLAKAPGDRFGTAVAFVSELAGRSQRVLPVPSSVAAPPATVPDPAQQWVAQSPVVTMPVDFSGQDLRDRDFKGQDLRGANLTDANLTDANLTNANLTDANLTRADLWGANLTDANLNGADLSHADLRDADLRDADLSGATLKMDLSGANLTFAKANLTFANLRGATLLGADLSGANLSDADLTYANLDEADLAHANLTRANLTGANLTGANLDEANLRDANLTRANLFDANLDEADLTDANLTNANLTRAFRRRGINRADLAGVKGLDSIIGLGD